MSALDDLSQLPAPTPPPLSSQIEAELAQLSPVAPRRPLRQLALLFAISVIYGAGVLAWLTLRRDLAELPMGWLLGAGLAWLFGFVVPVYLATVPRAGAVMPRWKLAGASAILGALGFIALGFAIHPSAPSSAPPLGWEHFARGYGCLELGLGTAIVPVVVGAIFLRGALPVGSRWSAAALGAGGGSLGGLMLHLHCPIAEGLHVGLMHGGVVAIAALLAAALVPRATDVR
ncbi:MAG TPA: NrsF family protein [Kofleriaceae bacterium]|nr:NrsF family protein [Kofleriaceae bacterium]